MALTVDQILKQLQDQQNTAKAANEGRYQDILKLYEGQGASAKADIQQAGQEDKGQQQQSLVSRGLGNTGVLEAYAQNTNKNVAREQARVTEGVAMNKAGVMERRTDAYPDMGLYTNLLASLGKSQGELGPHHATFGSGAAGAAGRASGNTNSFIESAYRGGGGGGDTMGPVGSYAGMAAGGSPAIGGAGGSRYNVPTVVGGTGNSYMSMGGFMGPPSPYDTEQTPEQNATDMLGPDADPTMSQGAGAAENTQAPTAGEETVQALTNAGSNAAPKYRTIAKSSAKWAPNLQSWYV